jgi:hypothetical protein
MEKGVSKFENFRNKEAFKEVTKRREAMRERIEKRRKLNLKKMNTIKVKKYSQ